MTLKVYEYKNCSTCKKALRFLDDKKIKYTAIAIVDSPPNLAELKQMLKAYQGDIKKLFNTSGEIYRELKLSEKLPNMSDDEALSLLARNGKLIKRPFVLGDKTALVGFKEDEWMRLDN